VISCTLLLSLNSAQSPARPSGEAAGSSGRGVAVGSSSARSRVSRRDPHDPHASSAGLDRLGEGGRSRGTNSGQPPPAAARRYSGVRGQRVCQLLTRPARVVVAVQRRSGDLGPAAAQPAMVPRKGRSGWRRRTARDQARRCRLGCSFARHSRSPCPWSSCRCRRRMARDPGASESKVMSGCRRRRW